MPDLARRVLLGLYHCQALLQIGDGPAKIAPQLIRLGELCQHLLLDLPVISLTRQQQRPLVHSPRLRVVALRIKRLA